MRFVWSEDDVLSVLKAARSIAQRAQEMGIVHLSSEHREPVYHVGAVLADAALQAGLNYRSVVKTRVDRIVQEFPEAATLSGLFKAIGSVGVNEFLRWQHHTKVSRFISLAELLRDEGVDDFGQLRAWLEIPACREQLRAIRGVGPKTVDYICGLVGLEFIAVDRHIRAFASDAGVNVANYEFIQIAVAYAADLLGVSRRHFDASIWIYVSDRKAGRQQQCAFQRPLGEVVAAGELTL
ncbi:MULTISPECIES: hypothetical protein [unclassified Bradyrhizobium]|uniref:hypothetical protein n=1 Tax=unclassified Bradyrhizobium TaxID=2631580 RepID=UPI0028E7BE93|nr:MULTISPECIES: hypothetical protein [unclassified Bradyrhizobium]